MLGSKTLWKNCPLGLIVASTNCFHSKKSNQTIKSTWYGCTLTPDPATALLEQVKHDPDGDALAGLMAEWRTAFGSTPATVRKAVERAELGHTDLLDAMREFPVEEKGSINRSKLGWLLKKNANRIVGGFVFQQATADGRVAWRVVAVNPPPLTPLPPFSQPVAKTVAPAPNKVVEVEV